MQLLPTQHRHLLDSPQGPSPNCLLEIADTSAVLCSKALTKQSDELSPVLSDSPLSCAVSCAELPGTDDVHCTHLRDGRHLNTQQLRRLPDEVSMNEADAILGLLATRRPDHRSANEPPDELHLLQKHP